MIYLFILIVAAAGIGVGVTVGLAVGKRQGEKKVDREMELTLLGMQLGLTSKCPMCKQPIVKSAGTPAKPPTR